MVISVNVRCQRYLLCRFVKLLLRKSPLFLFLFGHCFASAIAVLFSVREWAPSSSSEYRKQNRGLPSLHSFASMEKKWFWITYDLAQMKQPLPSLLFVVKSHKRFTRFKVSGAVPYIPRSFEKGHRKSYTVT